MFSRADSTARHIPDKSGQKPDMSRFVRGRFGHVRTTPYKGVRLVRPNTRNSIELINVGRKAIIPSTALPARATASRGILAGCRLPTGAARLPTYQPANPPAHLLRSMFYARAGPVPRH